MGAGTNFVLFFVAGWSLMFFALGKLLFPPTPMINARISCRVRPGILLLIGSAGALASKAVRGRLCSSMPCMACRRATPHRACFIARIDPNNNVPSRTLSILHAFSPHVYGSKCFLTITICRRINMKAKTLWIFKNYNAKLCNF